MSAKSKYLIVLGGPTASGKTTLAIRLARHFKTEVVSADSRQFYKEMSIGTAKPTALELAAVKHHFVGSRSIQDDYSVGQYEREAIALLNQLFERHDTVVLTGGSGLFINAVCQGLDDFPPVSKDVRDEVVKLFEERGIEALQEIVKREDFDYYQRVDLQNKQRLMRAVEVIRASGRPYSSFLAANKVDRNFTPIYLQVHHPRPKLYERINKRVALMIEEGLVEEVKGLLEFRSNNALQTVGYQEIFDHLNGNTSLERAIELIRQNSRRYAKRQITWMRRDGFWKHIRPSDWHIALDYIHAARSSNTHIRQYSGTDNLPPGVAWEKNTVMVVALWENDQLKEAVHLVKKGKRVILKPGYSPKELFLLHEVMLLKEELAAGEKVRSATKNKQLENEGKIEQYLDKLEQEKEIKILLACETGSRAWGFPSPDSDFDVRLIYLHKKDWYLSLAEQKDSIEVMYENKQIDISGWELRKTLRLLQKSNPALLERIQSPITYRCDEVFLAAIKQLAEGQYSRIAAIHHYLSMAKKSLEEIRSKETYKLKTFFYALRAATACKWILEKEEMPPIELSKMINGLILQGHLTNRIRDLIALKSTKHEGYLHTGEAELISFIENCIAAAEEKGKKLPAAKGNSGELDVLFRDTLARYDF